MRFEALIALVFSLLVPALSPAAAQTAERLSPWYLAQPSPFFGPWFDGWYTRYYDRKSGLTFALIATADQLSRGRVRQPLNGHLTLLVQEPGSDQVIVKSFTSEDTTLRNDAEGFTLA